MVLECRKLLKQKEDMGHGDDRISKLPDFLLHHILSFLKIKCVVRTSILSKRWKNVWATIPDLDFLEWLCPTTKDIHLEANIFMNFMDRMLLQHGTSNNIQKFSLKCDELLDASRMNSWISIVISCKVEVLILCGSLKEQFVMPLSLFTCGSLIKLSLGIKSDSHFDLSLPESISFPRLRYLELYRVTFRDEYLTEQLFTNCPVLEELRLKYCAWVNMKIVCISAPAMKSLTIVEYDQKRLNGLGNCEVKILAPSLQTLTYRGSVANAYYLSSFPSLIRAFIDLVITKKHPELGLEETSYGSSAVNLLGELSNVKRLIFHRTLKALSFAANLLSNLPTFHNLVHLSVHTEVKCSLQKALFLFLQKAPNLELLSFHKGFPPQTHDGNDDNWTPNMVAGSFFLHLTEVYFRQFSGTPREMYFVKLILKKARALKTMRITSSSSLSENRNSQMLVMKKLLRLRRKSKGCVLKFILEPLAE